MIRRPATTILAATFFALAAAPAQAPEVAFGLPAAPAQAHEVAVIVPRFLEAGGPPGEVTAQVRTEEGLPVPDGTEVTFSATLGVTFSAVTARTADGLAIVTAFPGAEAGFARLDATALGASGNATMWIRAGPAASAVLDATPAAAKPGGSVKITATVVDVYGNAAEGDQVVWHAEGGSLSVSDTVVERGHSTTVLVAGAGPWATVRFSSGALVEEIRVPIEASAISAAVYLPRVIARSAGCSNVLANSSFAADRDGNLVPDGWLVEAGAGSVRRVPAEGRSGWAVRLEGDGGAAAPSLTQSVQLPGDLESAALRVWLRAPDSSQVRLDAWSDAQIGGRTSWAPFLVETLPASPEWRLHVMALPLPPRREAEVSVTLRGAGPVDIGAIELEVCPAERVY